MYYDRWWNQQHEIMNSGENITAPLMYIGRLYYNWLISIYGWDAMDVYDFHK